MIRRLEAFYGGLSMSGELAVVAGVCSFGMILGLLFGTVGIIIFTVLAMPFIVVSLIALSRLQLKRDKDEAERTTVKYEIIGRPPESDAVGAVRRDFEAFLSQLESSPSKRVSVVFGFAWGNEIYERNWLALELTGCELRARVDAAEASGLGGIGSDDLHVTLPDIRIKRTYCHEADVHIVADESTNPYLEAQRQKWIDSGWEVHGREVA
jgi:hypothetical protein